MAIEFQCPHCGKTLKTSDDRAGIEAKCPGCSEVITIPSASTDGLEPADVPPEKETSPPADDERRRPCPMCGEKVLVGASKCRFCGESLDSSARGGDYEAPPAEFGAIWEATWQIYQQNLGMALVIFLLQGMIQSAGSMIPGFILGIVQAAVQMEIGPYLALYTLCQVLSFVVQSYLAAGQANCFLKFARGQEVEIGDLFQGGPFLGRAMLGGFLFNLMWLAGTVLLVIPGIFVMLYFWPYMYVIVDRDCGAIESLSISKRLTENSLGLSLVLGLAILGLQLLGLLMCCVGLIFTTPLSMLLVAVTYSALSSQNSSESD